MHESKELALCTWFCYVGGTSFTYLQIERNGLRFFSD